MGLVVFFVAVGARAHWPLESPRAMQESGTPGMVSLPRGGGRRQEQEAAVPRGALWLGSGSAEGPCVSAGWGAPGWVSARSAMEAAGLVGQAQGEKGTGWSVRWGGAVGGAGWWGACGPRAAHTK